MNLYQRNNTIFRSSLEPSWRLVLLSLSAHMSETNFTCWIATETIAEETGLARSSVTDSLTEMAKHGIVERYDAGHRSKNTRIVWEAVATFVPVKSARGGIQKKAAKGDLPSAIRTPTTDNRSVPTEDRSTVTDNRSDTSQNNSDGNTYDRLSVSTDRSSVSSRPIIGQQLTDNRSRSDHDPIMIQNTPPTPSFDSTVDVPAVNEEEEDNSFQQNPEDSDTQQPKSLHEPEQIVNPTDYDHDKDVNNEVFAALEELKNRKLYMTGIAGVDAKDIPVGYFARHIEDPEYTKSLWKDIADRAPKEKVRDIVPIDQLPPDPEFDALLAEQWKSPVTTGIPCLIGESNTETPPDDEPPKTFLRRSSSAAVVSNVVKKPVPLPLPPPPRISATGEVQTGDLFGRRPQGAPVAPVAIVEEVLPTTMLPPEVTDFAVLLANRPDGSQAQPVAVVQRWIRALVNAGITTPQQLEETTLSGLKFTSGIGENVANNIAKSMTAWGSSLAPDPRTRMHELRILAARHSTMPTEVNSRDRRWLKAASISWNDIRKMTDFNVTDFAKRIESARSAA